MPSYVLQYTGAIYVTILIFLHNKKLLKGKDHFLNIVVVLCAAKNTF